MALSLAEADAPHEYVVESVDGSAIRELLALGFVPGTRVRVVRRSRGHVLVAVGDARYSLGDEVARSVRVRRC
ncbi:MAG: hypothetical protein A3K65_00385 [Euryarchaeota archaeon RBG_16_68_12]|nr:MAG: hypothetical protein A3K65_00385 [Euryarchaeota archaeon RBG_16_68_12]